MYNDKLADAIRHAARAAYVGELLAEALDEVTNIEAEAIEAPFKKYVNHAERNVYYDDYDYCN